MKRKTPWQVEREIKNPVVQRTHGVCDRINPISKVKD